MEDNFELEFRKNLEANERENVQKYRILKSFPEDGSLLTRRIIDRIDENGRIITEQTVDLVRAGCGCFLKSTKEIAGTCDVCNRVLCSRHFRNSNKGAPLCRQHSRIITKKNGEKEIVNLRDYRIFLIKKAIVFVFKGLFLSVKYILLGLYYFVRAIVEIFIES